jgi:3-methylcrotonyl-CoA carboxylase beta subunit
MVGKNYEHGGIAKNGAKLVTAVSSATVPKITILVGGSFGAGNYGMCGRAYQPRFLFMWPNAKISVMGPEQAAGVLTQIKRESIAAKKGTWPAEEESAYRSEIEARYNAQASCYYSTARLWDDGVIDPRETRSIISQALNAAQFGESCSDPLRRQPFGVFRM